MSPSGQQPKLPVQQLAILSICRLAEPVALTGVFPYLPEMIESFGVAKEDVAHWAGTTSMVFSLAQAATSISWGRASDKFGRKPVILIALTCAMLTSILFGFSQSLAWAIAARALQGAGNGTVGIIRTMVAEMVPEKVLQPTAFSIMPMIWAIGSSFGPILGGSLAVPARSYPDVFGGIPFWEKYKFALPNLVAGSIFTVGIVTGTLFLRETLEARKNQKDYGIVVGRALTQPCRGRAPRLRSSPTTYDEETVPTTPRSASKRPAPKELGPPGWREVFTYNSTLNILSYTILAFHVVTFDQLVPVLLHLPYENHGSDENSRDALPFKFWGGYGLETARIGLLFTAMGICGIIAQFSIFPPIARRYGILRCFRVVTFVIPFIYIFLPFFVLLPTDSTRQAAVFSLMVLKTVCAAFAFPCTTILLTNSATSLRMLGTLNGVSVATSAIGRATGPFSAGVVLSWGAKRGYIVAPWFMLAFFAFIGHVSTWWLEDGDGPTAGVEIANDEDSDSEEEIMLLPNAHDPSSVQATGLVIKSNTDGAEQQQRDYYRDREYRDEGHDEFTTETQGLLGSSAPLSKTVSRENRINFGGTSLTRRTSSTRGDNRHSLSRSPALGRREARQPGDSTVVARQDSGLQGLGLNLEEEEE